MFFADDCGGVNMRRRDLFVVLAFCLCVVFLSQFSSAQALSWLRTSGPEGVHVYAIVVGPGGRLLAGTDRGVLLSSDGGENWTRRDSQLSSGEMTVYSVARDNTGRIYAGTSSEGVFVSTDSGATWVVTDTSLVYHHPVTSLATSPHGSVFASVLGVGICKSTDGGKSWRNVGLGDIQIQALFSDSMGSFAGTWENGIFRSIDDGENWIRVDSVLQKVQSFTTDFAGNLFAVARNGVYRSTDRGITWPRVLSKPGSDPGALVVDRRGVVHAGLWTGDIGDQIYRSTNNGASWDTSGWGQYVVKQPECLAVDSMGNIFAGHYSNGILRSTDGGTKWGGMSISSLPLVGALSDKFQIPSVAIDRKGNLYASMPGGVFRSTDGGARWVCIGLIATSALHVTSRGTLIAGKNTGSYYRWRNDSTGWDWLGWTSGTSGVSVITSDSEGTVYLGSLDGDVLHSTDDGRSWRGSRIPNHTPVRGLFIDAGNLYVLDEGGLIYASPDQGIHWNLVAHAPIARAMCFATDSKGAWFVGGNYLVLLRSTDKGASWSNCTPFQSDNPGLFTSIVTDPRGHVFAGTLETSISWTARVYYSLDYGVTWQSSHSAPLIGQRFVGLAVDFDGNVFVGSNFGVFRGRLLATGIKESSQATPIEFHLSQNYPNPFNPATTIRFSLPTSSFVTLRVYNLLGEEMTTLVSEGLGAGTYSSRWDANRLPSGVYFYRFQAGDLTETRKLLLLR